MKICKLMFSVNRLEYLIPTLESTDKFIDWGDHEVDGIFIDDMPTDRDDEKVFNLAYKYGYNNIVLHEENQGAAGTWRASYELLKDKGYDFVFMQEDDIIINQPIKIDNMIEYLNGQETISTERDSPTFPGNVFYVHVNTNPTEPQYWLFYKPVADYLMTAQVLNQRTCLPPRSMGVSAPRY